MAPAARRPHPALLPALLGIGLALAAAARLADPALPLLFLTALGLGAAFVWCDFGFAGGFRALLEEGDGGAVAATAIIPALLAPVVILTASVSPEHGRFVTPIGLPLLLGALIFGIGMQVANGCGSGVLVAAGQGSRRMWVALPFFCLGGVLGSLLLPMGLALPAVGEADLVTWFGPWGAVAATEALLLLAALALLRGRRLPRRRLASGALIAGLAASRSGAPGRSARWAGISRPQASGWRTGLRRRCTARRSPTTPRWRISVCCWVRRPWRPRRARCAIAR
nr:YeeE/YedE family protein [Rubritepida sp.]